jgi:hypothetical protein
MKLQPLCATLVIVLFAVVCPVIAQEAKQEEKSEVGKKTDKVNPVYESWVKQSVGTTVTMAGQTTADGQVASKMKMVYKLVSKAEDKVVVEMSTKLMAAGQEFDGGASKMTIEKYIRETPEQADAVNMPKSETKKGTETLKLGGQNYECDWTRVTMKIGDNEVISKTWNCDSVPGMMVKMFSETGGSQTEITLESIEKK